MLSYPWSNNPVERMAAGGRRLRFRVLWAAATAHRYRQNTEERNAANLMDNLNATYSAARGRARRTSRWSHTRGKALGQTRKPQMTSGLSGRSAQLIRSPS